MARVSSNAASTVLVLAPNWLGDAVMALPAIADLRRHFPLSTLAVAARGGVADLFAMVPGVDRVVRLEWKGTLKGSAERTRDIAALRALGAEVGVLLPNSFASAWLLWRAGARLRWGYATDARSLLLNRAVRVRPGRRHQGEYYQRLLQEIGFDTGPLEPALRVPESALAEARALLTREGWDGTSPLITLAPGAAYGTAKQWIPAHVTTLVGQLTSQGATCVLVGAGADAATTTSIRASLAPEAAARTIDLAGKTTLAQLAAVLRLSTTCVSNDSGAMHVAAALGTPVVATFGPTREDETRPLTAAGGRAIVLINPVECRPCMKRECPIDHRCMTGLSPDTVREAVARISSPAADPGAPR